MRKYKLSALYVKVGDWERVFPFKNCRFSNLILKKFSSFQEGEFQFTSYGEKYKAFKRYFPFSKTKGFVVMIAPYYNEAFSSQMHDLFTLYGLSQYYNAREKTFDVFEAASNILTSLDIEEVFTRITSMFKMTLGAEQASIFRYDQKDKKLRFVYSGGYRIYDIEVPTNRGIAGWVVRNKKICIVQDVHKDKRFYRDVDQRTKFKTRSILAAPLIVKNRVIGVVEVLNKIGGEFKKEDAKLLKKLSHLAAIALENANLYNRLASLFLSSIRSIANAVEAKDPYTSGHVDRVERWAVLLGRAIGMNEENLDELKLAGILHDVGKIAIPDAILRKPGSLTKKEYEIIKTHVTYGTRILKPIEELVDVLPGVLYHHERFDGKGYPDGLKRKQIPLIARILSIVDAFDAMSSNRPYRKALSPSVIVREFKKNKGKQFDPELVDVFLRIPKIRKFLNRKK